MGLDFSSEVMREAQCHAGRPGAGEELRVLHLDPQAAGREGDTRPGLGIWNCKAHPQWHISSNKATSAPTRLHLLITPLSMSLQESFSFKPPHLCKLIFHVYKWLPEQSASAEITLENNPVIQLKPSGLPVLGHKALPLSLSSYGHIDTLSWRKQGHWGWRDFSSSEHYAAFAAYQNSVPSTTLQLANVTPVLEDAMPSSGLRRHCTYMVHRHAYKYWCTQIKKK